MNEIISIRFKKVDQKLFSLDIDFYWHGILEVFDISLELSVYKLQAYMILSAVLIASWLFHRHLPDIEGIILIYRAINF